MAPTAAMGQFQNYADPPADQYNQPPQQNPGSSGVAGTQDTTPATQSTTGDTGNPSTGQADDGAPLDDGGPADEGADPKTIQTAKPGGTKALDDGTLPFTGNDLTLLVLLALLLVAVGSALAVAERTTRKRREAAG